MSAVNAFLHQLEDLPGRDLLTLVLAGGCNLNCSWCAVSARSERFEQPAVFEAGNYRNLISSLAGEGMISGVAIVGDEPLLDGAWPVAHEIVECARGHGLPSAIVTNATKLAERSEELSTLDNQIIVSLDGVGSYHDSTRRVAGAYADLIRGFESVADKPRVRDRITVSSVVQPDKYEYLSDIPGVLVRHGIKRWALAPLIQFRRTKPARLHPRLFPAVYDELPLLIEKGREAGIDVMIDDGLSLLLQADREGKLEDQPTERPAESNIRLLRMRPDGTTQRFTDLLVDADSSRGLRWDGVEPPAEFYRRLYEKNPDPVAA